MSAAGDERAFVPEELSNTEANGADGGLTLIAFTLVQRERGLDLYAAARNDAATPVCEPGMTTDFVDHDARLAGSAGMTLYTGHFYRIEDGSNAIISCVPPGEIAIGAVLSLPESIIIDELAFLQHAFPAFIVANLTPVGGLTLRDVEAVTHDARTGYTGTLKRARPRRDEPARFGVSVESRRAAAQCREQRRDRQCCARPERALRDEDCRRPRSASHRHATEKSEGGVGKIRMPPSDKTRTGDETALGVVVS